MGTAAAMIAHEVNNLLTPIISYATAALEGSDAELKDKAIAVTLKNARMLIAMSERVLEISAAKPAKRESVSVQKAMQDALASLCRDIARDGISMRIDVAAMLTVWTDPLQLQQVFFNLLLNAREAMAATHSGRLTVTARSKGDQVVIEVNNSGEPIPPDLLPHVFEPFQTTKPATRNGKSRCGGLGLALCRDLIEENGGTITVTSDAQAGTTFILTLPARAPKT